MFPIFAALLAEKYKDALGLWVWVIFVCSGVVLLYTWGGFSFAWGLITHKKVKSETELSPTASLGGPHPEVLLSTEWPSDWPRNASHREMRFVEPLNQPYERPFVVSNESDITAHNVKIRDIAHNGKRVTFNSIDFVRKGEDKPSLPRVLASDIPIMQSRSLAPLFDTHISVALNSGRVAKMKETIPVVTDYEDIHGGKWETEQELTYDVWYKTAQLRLLYCGTRRP